MGSERWPSLLRELQLAAEAVKRWPKWMRVEHERMKAAERWFNEPLENDDVKD
jgi:hypothetical protein